MEKQTEEKIVLDEIRKILEWEDPFHMPATCDIPCPEEFRSLLDEVKRLKMENYDLNCALESSADSIHITDGEGNVLRVNAVFEKSTGEKRENIIGRNVRYAEAEQIYVPSVVRLCINERRKLTMIQRTPKAGPKSDAITTSTPIFDDNGNIFRVISNARPLNYFSLIYDYFHDVRDNNLDSPSGIELSSKDPEMQSLITTAHHIAQVSSGVLITGESGTGKSLLARYIREHSSRSEHRFVELNCAAIPESLMESELFGYEAGAFTGASAGGKQGLIELAHHGTLFLDEIGDMPLSLQAKLLQVLQNKRITRVGGSKEIDVDIRIISATHQDLEAMIKNDQFRQDLYYRLNIIPLELPPLRQRTADIVPLTEQFVAQFNSNNHKEVVVSKAAYARLLRYNWPGNIRELENLMERLVATNRDGFIKEEDLPENIRYGDLSEGLAKIRERRATLPDIMEDLERQIIKDAYQKYKNSYKVAEVLGISQSGANRKIMKYVTKSNGALKKE
ncbi:sigma 54-interacting transcriptional regulator [Anaerovorax odorimutans]|uniref:HTH-type transcriptional regulatory protein TyrR n=1 Tax=Anaerovorax odorimutans TaxID=109327 RepID=A0ABT1RNT7_9FIRM|nr:sigma 54-interacting transcriptional regulator [Anaerovorax odorimutans]MCQ4636833.1 sigma 54-interacting transcriptional regulator [Anaerovorax odorimutans]